MPEFDGLGGFIAFLPKLTERLAAAQDQGRHDAGAVVRAEVIAVFDGTPGGTGPVAAWPALTLAAQVAHLRLGVDPTAEVMTGALRDSVAVAIGDTGRVVVGVPGQVVGSGRPGDPVRDIGDVAVAQEMGFGPLPARSFLGVGGFRAAEAAARAFVTPVLAVLAGQVRPGWSTEGDASHGDD